MKKTSDDDFQVMGPPPPRIKQAEFHKPKRESILELKVKHAGRVAASIKQFETGSTTPVVKSMLTRKESLANKKSDCHPSKIFSKGQAKLPISTHLLKPTEQAAVTNEDELNTETKSRKPSRRPSIYYAKDSDAPKRDQNKTQDTTIDDSVFEAAVATPLPEEPMETCENGGTPLKLETVPENTPCTKLPKILQPLGDSVILRTPGGLTPKRVLQRSNTSCSPRSPIKAVKRLGSSPGSPGRHLNRRHSMSPRRAAQNFTPIFSPSVSPG
uniref:Uncharacterized protein n=1 Tax=Magallana gigas TaxID=29159 RepID=A0A8W8I8D1_MAGGI